ncbi:hypothetical protein HMPREF2137_00155 [Hoylesella buccalis DNF00853]|uniref:Uncharacterized protein n=1 Tax=Hoylesella buccalis DNF00853 TaxID=1401074 RepID=A0A096B3Y9_9BACT|nr:hypothetical protein HMPREF2137_00155 [Hoylesella buccalis DNF00853]
MQTTSRYASRTSASLDEGYSFIALRFLICKPKEYYTIYITAAAFIILVRYKNSGCTTPQIGY